MGENQGNLNAEPQVPSIKEDWGGDGSGRMNLSGRSTAISQKYVPRQYQYFDTNTVLELEWQIRGIPENLVLGKKRTLTWHDCGASTAKVLLSPDFYIPPGVFSTDLELFILSGCIQIGDWKFSKHGYSFIPAGVKFGNWRVVGEEKVEILWMENGPGKLEYQGVDHDLPNARMNEFIPALDTKLLPWGRTDTVQFVQSQKKWLRKDSNGGGVWLLAILPHYDGLNAMIQSYNEEGYCLAGYCDIGDYRFVKDYIGYIPSFTISPRHITDDGCLFLIRVDRDLSKVGTVLSYPYEDVDE